MDSFLSPEYRIENLSQRDLKSLIHAIKDTTGIDLGEYAISSMRRRFLRFIQMNKISDVDELILRIRNGNGFSEALIKELTVNTTEMFRDPTFWSLLRDDILPKFSVRDNIRIWHAACSTGEEVFSMAILLQELGMLDRVSIVATDINRNVLETASRGIYPHRNQKINGSNHVVAGGNVALEDYYELKDNQAHYDTDLIRNVEFRYHDLVQDGVFPLIDLVICRNVLIYFNFELQAKVVQILSESLANGGVLGIGSKESIIWCDEAKYFSVISLNDNLYRKKYMRSDESMHVNNNGIG